MNTCSGGVIVPAFEKATAASTLVEFGAVGADAAVVSCKTGLKPPDDAACANFTKWSQWTGAACYFFFAAAESVETYVKNHKLMEEIYHAIGIVYTAIRGVNGAFNEAIKDVNDGKPFTPIIEPSDPPEFPPVTPGSHLADLIQNAWNAIQPFLEQAISKINDKDPTSLWIKVIQGLIDNSKKTIDQIVELIKSIESK